MAWYTSVADIALSWIILIISLIIIGGFMILLTRYILKELQYKYKCFIFESGNENMKEDKAGIFVDKKTHNKRFFLKKNKVGLNPDQVPYKNIGSKKTVFLLQDGLKNFRYLSFPTPKANPGLNVSVGEEDVNWAVNVYERQKKMFARSLIMQLMPFIALAFTAIIILIIFIYFFKEFGTLKDMAVAMHAAASELAKAKLGTTVIS